jgi:ATP-dependent protease HslVU (ClpYQ) peptidase subunit
LDNAREIFETFRRLQKILTGEYHIHDYDDPEASFASSQIHALIVNQHGIFSLAADRTVIEIDRFWAIGCGSPIALGAMHAVYEQSEDPEAIARAGIHSACEFDLRCALPMKCHAVDLKDTPRSKTSMIRAAEANGRIAHLKSF